MSVSPRAREILQTIELVKVFRAYLRTVELSEKIFVKKYV